MVLRRATRADVPTIAEIYDYEVEHSTATFDTRPLGVEGHAAWLERHEGDRHPVIVAEEGGRVLGWASLSPWSDRCAYARAAEVSVYVHRDHQGCGVGHRLLAELITRGRAAGLGVLLARIVGDSVASRRLHERLGFRHIGTMRRVGEKFGRILDVELFDLQLDRDS